MRKKRGRHHPPTALKGEAEFRAVLGEGGKLVFDSLKRTLPDLARLLVEFPFGEIYARPGLSRKTRELIAIAALAAQGNARPQLKMHVQGALRCGCSRKEVLEVLLMITVFAGFPATLNGVEAAQEAFDEYSRTRKGVSSK